MALKTNHALTMVSLLGKLEIVHVIVRGQVIMEHTAMSRKLFVSTDQMTAHVWMEVNQTELLETACVLVLQVSKENIADSYVMEPYVPHLVLKLIFNARTAVI